MKKLIQVFFLLAIVLERVSDGAKSAVCGYFKEEKELQILRISNSSVKLRWVKRDSDFYLMFRDDQNRTVTSIVLEAIGLGLNYTLTGLRAGGRYSYQFCKREHPLVPSTGKNIGNCTGRTTYFTTRPNAPQSLSSHTLEDKDSPDESSLVVEWQPPLPECSFSHYQVTIEPDNGRRLSIVAERQATFINLTPGRLYTVTVNTVSNYEKSESRLIQRRLRPNPPSTMTVKIINSAEIYVAWLGPRLPTDFDRFGVFLSTGKLIPPDFNVTSLDLVEPNTHFLIYKNVHPCRSYRVFVMTVSADTPSSPIHQDVLMIHQSKCCPDHHRLTI